MKRGLGRQVVVLYEMDLRYENSSYFLIDIKVFVLVRENAIAGVAELLMNVAWPMLTPG